MRERVGMRAAGETQNRCNDKKLLPIKNTKAKPPPTLQQPCLWISRLELITR